MVERGMQHNTDILWTNILGGSFSGIDNLVVALGIKMAIDYISGIMEAFTAKVVSSKTAFHGQKKALCA